jgi:uncharacterized protein YrrD
VTGEPVSWMLIEAGWKVVGRDGEQLGSVHEVIGDSNVDIFNGLAVSPGMLRGSRYVPAERVVLIVEGEVELDVDADQFKQLAEHRGTPASAEIRADTTDLR